MCRKALSPCKCQDILLKRSLKSVARISLYNRLQNSAYSERFNRSNSNFQRMFPTLQSPISVKCKQLLRLNRKYAPKAAHKSNFQIYAKGLRFFNCLVMDHQYLAKLFLNVGYSLRFWDKYDHFLLYNQQKTE